MAYIIFGAAGFIAIATLSSKLTYSLGKGLEQFLHRRDGFTFTDTNLTHGSEGQSRDVSPHIGDPSKVRIVKSHQMAVGGGVNIGLQVLVSQRDGVGEGRQGE